jgi:HPt (histidine-containing phosphotransfer) domain-containing protein
MDKLKDFLKKAYFHKDVTIAYTRVYATLGSTGFLAVMIDGLAFRHSYYVASLAFVAIVNLYFGVWLFEKGLRKFVKIYRPTTSMGLIFLCIQECGGISSPILLWFSNVLMGVMFAFGILPTVIVVIFELIIVTYLNFSAAAPNPALYFHLTFSLTVMLGIGIMFSKISEYYFSKLMLQKAKTEEKSKQIKALLDGIPQGILTLGPEGEILPDYSRHLLSILETDTIDGNFYSVVLQRAAMSSDEIDRCWQSILNVIGTDQLNYEVNVGNLLPEIKLKIGNQIKYLKCTWNIDDHEDVVSKILVTILDVTNEKQIEQAAEAQAKEFALIKELIEVEPKKISQFFASSRVLLSENARYLTAMRDSELSIGVIQTMFVNLHTAKGAARTLGLKDLARVFHEVEDYFHDILKQRKSPEISKLIDGCQQAQDALDHYIEINQMKLNRREEFTTVTLSRDFVENHYKVLTLLSERITCREMNIVDMVQAIADEKLKLISAIYDQLPSVFNDYKAKAEKIAQDLGKAPPIFRFDIPDISMKPEMRTLLDNCMIHLLRNALDHGIEEPSERHKKGKADQGCLSATATVEDQILRIDFHDDGRGLAIAALRARGLDRSLIKADAKPEEIAELIFHSGISTVDKVSAISGRGIGMDAVRSFLAKQGGSIDIELGPSKDANGDFVSFRFVIRIPGWNPASEQSPSLAS